MSTTRLTNYAYATLFAALAAIEATYILNIF